MAKRINTDIEKKAILEGQRKYREVIASQYAAGYSDAEEKLIHIDIEEKDASLTEKDAEIEKLLARIKEL